MSSHTFTIGVEEEYQIVDPETGELRSHVSKIIDGGNTLLKERIKSEMHQAVVESETGICSDIQQVKEEVSFLRSELIKIASDKDLCIAAAGTHPFSLWTDQFISEDDRYRDIVNEMRDVARSNLIFGLHVHIGIPSREEGLNILNTVRYFLPHIYALSTNSPFWLGRNTGFKSYRTKVFDKFPRTGIPPHFDSVAQYDKFIDILIKTNSIDNSKKIWWDLRLHPDYPTIEFRICDMPLQVEDTVCIAAIIQALVSQIHKLHKRNLTFREYRRALISENKWRAARYGIESKLIDFGLEKEIEFNILIDELLDFISESVDELGSKKEVEIANEILNRGTGADQQLKVYEDSQDLKKVMEMIVRETGKDL